MPVVPGSCFMEMVAPAVEVVLGDVAYELHDVTFLSLRDISSGTGFNVYLTMEPSIPCEWRITIESGPENGTQRQIHATMRLR
eukprot:3542152-Rhodomonas_salina.1